MTNLEVLLNYDLSVFVDDHIKYGYKSKKAMVQDALRELRIQMRIKATQHLEDEHGQKTRQVIISD